MGGDEEEKIPIMGANWRSCTETASSDWLLYNVQYIS